MLSRLKPDPTITMRNNTQEQHARHCGLEARHNAAEVASTHTLERAERKLATKMESTLLKKKSIRYTLSVSMRDAKNYPWEGHQSFEGTKYRASAPRTP